MCKYMYFILKYVIIRMYTFLDPTPLNYKTTLRLFYSNINPFTRKQTTLVLTLTLDCLTRALPSR